MAAVTEKEVQEVLETNRRDVETKHGKHGKKEKNDLTFPHSKKRKSKRGRAKAKNHNGTSDTNYRPLPFWCSARHDNKEKHGFIQIGESLQKDKRFHSLGPATKSVYFSMIQESNGKREFYFTAAIAAEYGISASTMRRAVTELVEKEFVAILWSGKNDRAPNRYEFSYAWKNRKD